MSNWTTSLFRDDEFIYSTMDQKMSNKRRRKSSGAVRIEVGKKQLKKYTCFHSCRNL